MGWEEKRREELAGRQRLVGHMMHLTFFGQRLSGSSTGGPLLIFNTLAIQVHRPTQGGVETVKGCLALFNRDEQRAHFLPLSFRLDLTQRTEMGLRLKLATPECFHLSLLHCFGELLDNRSG